MHKSYFNTEEYWYENKCALVVQPGSSVVTDFNKLITSQIYYCNLELVFDKTWIR